jgi:hypothetical protein
VNEATAKEALKANLPVLGNRQDIVGTTASRLLLVWKHFQKTDLSGVVAFLKKYASTKNVAASLFVVDVLVDGHPFLGTWRNKSVNLVLSEDESGTLEVHQELVLCSDITGANSAARATTVAGLTTVRRVLLKTEGALSLWPGVSEGIEIRVPNVKLTTANEGYWKTDAAGGILSTDLVTAFSLTGYTILERTWAESEDGAVATLILLAGKATWAKTFAADKVQVAQTEQGGFSRKASDRVEGVPIANIATLRNALNTAETATAWATGTAYNLMDYVSSGESNYVCGTAHTSGTFATDLTAGYWIKGNKIVVQSSVQDNKDGSLSGTREQMVGYAGTTSADATITVIEDQGDITISRIWYQRTAAAAATLVASVGAARSGYTFETVTYASVDTQQTDNGNGTFTVQQRLVQMRTLAKTVDAEIAAELAGYPNRITHESAVLNLFGFREGAGEDLAVLIPNLDPSAAMWTKCMVTVTAAKLLEQWASLPGSTYGWSFLSRQWKEQANGTATLMVSLQKRTWSALVFASDSRDMQQRDSAGYARAKTLRLTGLTKAKAESEYLLVAPPSPTAHAGGTVYRYMDYVSYSDANYICVVAASTNSWVATEWIKATLIMVHKEIAEAGDGQYVLSAIAIPAYEGTATADSDLIRLKVSDDNSNAQVRVWPMRSLAAKNTLMGTGGAAITGITGWEHSDATVADHHNGTYTVTQTLYNTSDNDSGSFVPRWYAYFWSYEHQWRINRDGYAECVKIPKSNFYGSLLTEKRAYGWIISKQGKKVSVEGTNDTGTDTADTDSKITHHQVSRRGKYCWLAFVITENPTLATKVTVA